MPVVPLPVLMSRALGALTADLEQAAGDDVPSLALWSDVVRCVPDDGIDERELTEAARLSSRMATAATNAAVSHGWITADGKGKTRRLARTDAGRRAAQIWPQRLADLDEGWAGSPLRTALETLVAQLPFELPHFPASYGTADPSAIGGPYAQGVKRKDGLPSHANDWKAVKRADGDTVSSLPLTALLSQALMAFTIDYEDRFPWPLANTVTVLSHLGTEPRPLDDVPGDHGIAGNGKSLTERHLVATVTKDPSDAKKKFVALTDRGELVMTHHPKRLDAVQAEWNERFGEKLVAELRDALTQAAGSAGGGQPDYVMSSLRQ